MITIQFTEDEFETVLSQSCSFRFIVARTLDKTQSELAKSVKPTEEQLMSRLVQYVRNNFSSSSKIAGIKYVRQFAADNKDYLSVDTHNRLGSIGGAKTFVDNLIP